MSSRRGKAVTDTDCAVDAGLLVARRWGRLRLLRCPQRLSHPASTCLIRIREFTGNTRMYMTVHITNAMASIHYRLILVLGNGTHLLQYKFKIVALHGCVFILHTW